MYQASCCAMAQNTNTEKLIVIQNGIHWPDSLLYNYRNKHK